MNQIVIPDSVLSDAFFDMDFDVRPTYSGRGMYGEECLGVVVARGDEIKFAVNFAMRLREIGEDWEWVGDVAQDSMGHGTILYWNGVHIDGDVE